MEVVLARPICLVSIRHFCIFLRYHLCPVYTEVSHSSATPCSIVLSHSPLLRFVYVYNANLKYLIFTCRKYSVALSKYSTIVSLHENTRCSKTTLSKNDDIKVDYMVTKRFKYKQNHLAKNHSKMKATFSIKDPAKQK